MSTLINTITSTTSTSFSSVPTVKTQGTAVSTTKLASIGYTNANIPSTTYLDKTSNQTLNSSLNITNQCTLTDVDTPVGANQTLTIGAPTSTTLTIPSTITLRNIVQYVRYWAVGTPLLTTTTGTAVVCQKMQTGQVSVASATSVPIAFSPAFTSNPAIFLGVQGTTSTLVIAQNKWITLANNAGFTANYGAATANVVLNWMAIGT
jgi:hypothetical protein